MKLLNTILQFIFPKRCVVCEKHDDQNLCTDCLKEVPQVRNKKSELVFSALPYRHPAVKYSLWEFKFKNNPSAFMKLLPLVHDVLIDELTERSIFNNFQNPLLVPIPLHKNRHKARGFNQSELIAYHIHKINPDIFDINETGLIRSKDTEPQAKIANRELRKKNIEGCFEVLKPNAFHNRNIILIDDITTTGSTLQEAMKVLKKSGARNVYAFTVAK
jgi:ComF family protein